MPFGLCNAASTFERLIEKALRRLQWRVAVLYLDVIVVFGKTWEQHFDNLAQVLERLAEAGLKLKLNVTSDQGKQYESALFREMCKLLEINKTRTTPLHPRSDGMIERMIRIINDMLSKYIKSHQKDWDQCLDFITMAYNSTPHESTGISPYKLVFGREMSFPIDIITDKVDEAPHEPKYVSEYVKEMEDRMRTAHGTARKHLKVSVKRQKMLSNTNVKYPIYEKGDLAWRNQKKNIPGLKLKITRHWTGPWVIIDKLGDVIFKIQHSRASIPVVIYGDNLKPYKGNKMASWFKEIVREKTPVELPDVAKFFETALDQQDLSNELERKIDNRCDEKHSMAPIDPDSGDPQSIPIDNYTGSSPRKTWYQKTSRSQTREKHGIRRHPGHKHGKQKTSRSQTREKHGIRRHPGHKPEKNMGSEDIPVTSPIIT